jgi:hypothetical protein
MQGELLGEGTGRVTGVRSLRSDGQGAKAGVSFYLEIAFQGTNNLLGTEMSEFGTYWQVVRPGGVLYGEGENVMTTAEGEIAHWTGFGVGRPTGPVPAARYGVCGSFLTASGRLERLASVANIVEYEVDEKWGYRWKLWEWT